MAQMADTEHLALLTASHNVSEKALLEQGVQKWKNSDQLKDSSQQ